MMSIRNSKTQPGHSTLKSCNDSSYRFLQAGWITGVPNGGDHVITVNYIKPDLSRPHD